MYPELKALIVDINRVKPNFVIDVYKWITLNHKFANRNIFCENRFEVSVFSVDQGSDICLARFFNDLQEIDSSFDSVRSEIEIR